MVRCTARDRARETRIHAQAVEPHNRGGRSDVGREPGRRADPIQAEFAGTFTSQAPGSSTGYRLTIDYRNPADPGGKPYSVATIVQRLHPGTVIDTSVAPRCEASDAELIARGASACPSATRVGGGELDADIGAPVGPVPRVIENRVVFFNARRELILFTESTNVPGRPIRTSGRVAVGEGTLTSMVPPVSAAPPPDPFLAVERVDVVLDRLSNARGRFITTPPTCPGSGVWTNRATFTYRDGVSQTEASRSPCRAAAGTGTPGDDVLVGTAGDDFIRCGSGHDRVDGRGGDDVIDCGSGDDVVRGEAGEDRLLGGSGDDLLEGGSGDDELFGDSGDDRLVGGEGRDSLDSGTGVDSVTQ